MKINVIGYKRQTGTYNERPYDNYVFYFTDVDRNDGEGVIPAEMSGKLLTYKIKVSEWDLQYPGMQPADFLHQYVNVYKDLYNNISSIQIVGE